MSDSSFGNITFGYTAADGQRLSGRPRLVHSADGKTQSLVIGPNDHLLVSLSIDRPVAELWEIAYLETTLLAKDDD